MQEIFILLFFSLIADLIKIDVSDNFVNLSEHFMQMTGDLSFEKRTQREFAVLLCFSSVRITGLLDMAIYLQLIIKITQSDSSGFQSKG